MKIPLLEMKNITKGFPGVLALDNVNISVEAGECHALVGENGAGKSTLMKILSGAYQPDSGSIKIESTCPALFMSQYSALILFFIE